MAAGTTTRTTAPSAAGPTARTASGGLVVLDEADWLAREAAHHTRVDGLTAGHRARAGAKHPVEDFLWTYYSLRPAQLRRWHPGVGVALAGDAARERLALRDHVAVTSGDGPDDGPDGTAGTAGADGAGAVTLDVTAFAARRGDAVRHVRNLLAATASRPVHLGCFGLHEWAMVYRLDPGDVRHAGLPLRLGAAGSDAVVESHRIRCTHFDAFRFFTDDARPLNAVQPRREVQVDLDQPGCLHATMDLYKWAYKLLPATPSDLVADCFELARDVRLLDMQASPYDLTAFGHRPVRIETPEGKTEYAARQRGFADRAAPLRAALVEVCERVLAAVPTEPDGPDGVTAQRSATSSR